MHSLGLRKIEKSKADRTIYANTLYTVIDIQIDLMHFYTMAFRQLETNPESV